MPKGLSNSGRLGLIAGVYPGSTANPFQAIAGSVPWGPIVGPQPAAMWYTNDDTIWPNVFNVDPDNYVLGDPNDIYDYLKRAPFRGGKWTTDTNYVLRIVYTQSENLAPQAAQVFIRKTDAGGTPTTGWVGYTMSKVDPTDTNFADGCVYYYQFTPASLPGGGGVGDYNYYFSFGDGTNIALYPNRPGAQEGTGAFPSRPADRGDVGVAPGDNDFYWFRVNHKPVLDQAGLTPSTGPQGQAFVFRTRYADKDGMARDANPQGDRPYKALIYIDLFGDVQGQMRVQSLAGNTITYGFGTEADGDHLPYPAGAFNPAGKPAMRLRFMSGAASGQEFTIISNSADTTTGTITVAGTLPAGIAAGDQIQVMDWFAATMEKSDPADNNYFDGCQYIFDTARAGMVLDPGTHNYFFEFWDNWAYWVNWEQYFMVAGSTPTDLKLEGQMTRLPASAGGYFVGPTVIGNRAPKMSAVYFTPPDADTLTSVVDATHLDYIRPLGRLPYADNSLVGKFLQFQTGLAALRVYQIEANTTSGMTVRKVSGSGDLVADRVVLGDTFRVFDDYSVAQGLSGAFHQDPTTTFDGTPATAFRIYATYSDADNTPPTSIRVALYSSPTQPANSPDAVYDMVRVRTGDNNYVAGVEYRTTRTLSLPPGRHWIRVQAYDGGAWASGGVTANDWFGPAVNPTQPVDGPVVIVNNPPNPPDSGFSPSGREIVNLARPTLRWNPATDPDPGDRVVRYTVQLSKTEFAGDAYDFQYVTTSNQVTVTRDLTDLTMWSWRVMSQDTLGAQSVWSEVQEFFVDLNRAPGVLAPPNGDPTQTLTPLFGDLSTVFRYQIVYSNADGIAPVSGVYVEIDGNLHPTQLTKLDPTATDYVGGVVYYIDIRGDSSALGYGAHQYRFYTGAVTWPAGAAPPANGPWVNSPSRLTINDNTWTQITQAEEGSRLFFQLTDPDKAGRPSVDITVTVAGGGDSETVTLNSFNAVQGIFRGSIQTDGAAGTPGDGVLSVQPGPSGTTVTATYSDPETVGSPSPDTVSADVLIVDSIAPPPVRPFLTVTSRQGTIIVLDWSGYVPVDDVAGYHVWLSNTAFTTVMGRTPIATLPADATSYEIPGMTPGNTYHVAVTAFDEIPNERRSVQSKPILMVDNDGPEAVDQSPVIGATEVPVTVPISFRLTDPSGVRTDSIRVLVNGREVTSQITKSPATGTPVDVLVSFTRTFTWNATITVRVIAQDGLGNGSDQRWQFSTVTDTTPPRVTDLSPTAGTTGVSPGEPIVFHVRDDVSGVDVNTLKLFVNGDQVPAGDLQIDATNLRDVIVSYVRPGGLPTGTRVTLIVSVADRAGNMMPNFVWRLFTNWSISGRVTRRDGTGMPGVLVTNGVLSATTGADGRYALLGVDNGTYTVVPGLEFFRFEPVNRVVTINNANRTGVSFVAIPQTYSVSGTILDASSNPVPDVTVSDGARTTTTNAQGRYILSGLLPGTVTITPTKAGWAFSPVSQQTTVPVTGPVDFVGYRSFSRTFPAGLQMIGVPFDPLVRTAATVFGTNAIHRWNPLASPPGYVRPADAGSAAVLDVRPGKGYFVSYAAPTTISGAGVAVPTGVPYVMTLGPAWNMIANPFPMNLPVANLRPAQVGGTDSYVFIYDNESGSYQFVAGIPAVNVARAHLLPWEGAWIRSLVGTTSLSATAPAGAAAADIPKPQSLAMGEGGYIIPVVARAGGRADLCSAAGVRTEGALQVANPPAVSGSVDLYFVDEAGQALAQQFKPAAAGAQSWNFVVATDLAKAEVAVSLPDLSQVPNDMSVLLIDEDAGRTVYMRTTPQYTFRTGAEGAIRHFRLEVTPRDSTNLTISAAAAQQSGPGVTVTYTVSAPCQVSVEVLNLAGRVVRRLTADAVVAAGVNSQAWNLRTDSGAAVPAGVYLVRVQAASDTGQRVQAVTQVNVVR